MRQIEFRGMTINGQWVYGYGVIIQPNQIDIRPAVIVHAEGLATEKYTIVIPSTIGQFTGHVDANGAKIWEGDVMDTGVVSFENGCFVVTYPGQEWSDCLSEMVGISVVIGKIHEGGRG
jgi:hypothetical protein